MTIVAIHQPNFIPPFSFFVKMAICDVFVVLNNVQFSTSNYQNFQTIFGKKWVVPVAHGGRTITEKQYKSGYDLVSTNMKWIEAIAMTLGIDVAKLKCDYPTMATKTERLIEMVRYYGGDAYLANKTAPEKYLDVELMEKEGIKFIPLSIAHDRNILEMFSMFGIARTAELIQDAVIKFKEDLYALQVKEASSVDVCERPENG